VHILQHIQTLEIQLISLLQVRSQKVSDIANHNILSGVKAVHIPSSFALGEAVRYLRNYERGHSAYNRELCDQACKKKHSHPTPTQLCIHRHNTCKSKAVDSNHQALPASPALHRNNLTNTHNAHTHIHTHTHAHTHTHNRHDLCGKIN